MTSIERTAYPRFTRAPSVKELRTMFTPTPTDVAFVATHARGPAQKFALMILLKVYQWLHYFPYLHIIPGAVIGHIRSEMRYPPDLVPDIASATLYRYYAAIRSHLEIRNQGKETRHITARAMYTAAQVMESPADLINAAAQMLLLEHCELPAFSTLDRMAWRIHRLVNTGIYQNIFARLTPGLQQTLSSLLERDITSPLTAFDRLKDPRDSHVGLHHPS